MHFKQRPIPPPEFDEHEDCQSLQSLPTNRSPRSASHTFRQFAAPEPQPLSPRTLVLQNRSSRKYGLQPEPKFQIHRLAARGPQCSNSQVAAPAPQLNGLESRGVSAVRSVLAGFLACCLDDVLACWAGWWAFQFCFHLIYQRLDREGLTH